MFLQKVARRPLLRLAAALALRRAAALAALLVGAPALLAQEAPGPLVTDRPDQTESTSVVPPGFVQLEAGWTVSGSSDEAEGERIHTLPEALVRIGLTRWLEARLALPTWTRTSARSPDGSPDPEEAGFGDARLGLKLGIVEGEGGAPSVALLAGTTLPTGEEGFGSERADPFFRLAASGDPSGRFSAGVNLGLQWETESGPGPSAAAPDTQADWLYTAALGIGLSEAIGMFVEGFGLVGLEGSRPASHAVDGGFTLRLADNLQLDLRAGAGLDGDAEDWFVGAGFAARLPR